MKVMRYGELSFLSKAQAERVAARFRERGRAARVAPTGDYWCVEILEINEVCDA